MMIHRVWEEPGLFILRFDDVPHSAADGLRPTAEVRILAAGQEGHDAQAIDTAATVAVLPRPVFALLLCQPFESPFINDVDLRRNLPAETQDGILRAGNSDCDQEGECRQENAKSHGADNHLRGF
jgi:hypothetical protein